MIYYSIYNFSVNLKALSSSNVLRLITNGSPYNPTLQLN